MTSRTAYRHGARLTVRSVTAPVDAQTHGQVVNFTSDKSGGDLLTLNGITPDPGTTCIFSFDYLGFGNACGWAGITDDTSRMLAPPMWVVTPTDMTNDGNWHSYTYSFSTPWFGSDSVWLAFEQNDGTPCNCYFDNVQVYETPEPQSFCAVLMGVACTLIGRRRKTLG